MASRTRATADVEQRQAKRERFEAAEVADRAECVDLAEPADRYPVSPRRELTPDAVE